MSKITFFLKNIIQLISFLVFPENLIRRTPLFTLSLPGSLCTLWNPMGVQPFFFSSSSHWYLCLSAFFPRCLFFQRKINRRDDWHWLSIKKRVLSFNTIFIDRSVTAFCLHTLTCRRRNTTTILLPQYCYRYLARKLYIVSIFFFGVD